MKHRRPAGTLGLGGTYGDPALAAPGERIVFNRPCADEEPARVKA